MFCDNHSADAAVAKCTGCGAFLCATCRRRDAGRALCERCFGGRRELAIRVFPVPPRAPSVERVAPPPALPSPPLVPAQPFVPRAPRRPRPWLAGLLGIAPGLGHVY